MSSESDSEPEVDLNNLKGEIFLKILILGDLGVGKTSLVKKYCYADSGPEYKVSVDVTHSVKTVNVNGTKVNLQLWDIPGHERFGGMTRVHYKVSILQSVTKVRTQLNKNPDFRVIAATFSRDCVGSRYATISKQTVFKNFIQ